MISRQMSQDDKEGLKLPLLFVDVDGVLSVFGFPRDAPAPGRFHSVDGMPHCLAHGCGERLNRLSSSYELVWATGWEERANEHLPHLLGLSAPYPTLSFDHRPEWGSAHWKLSALDRHAGDRPAAWIDDNFNDACRFWAKQRKAPTLLVPTQPEVGITDEHVEQLERWASQLTDSTK